MDNISKIIKYPSRDDILFSMFDRIKGKKTMVRCGGCKKRFKNQGETSICPTCGRKITKDTSVILSGTGYKFFNNCTTMFVDGEIITISLFILSLSRDSGQHYPFVGENAVRLKVRFDTVKKTAVAYMKNIDLDESNWRYVKLPAKFLNFTQPIFKYMYRLDIKLPSELVKEFCNLIEVEDYSGESITLEDLAWLNRTRQSLDECNRQKSILSILSIEYYNTQKALSSNRDMYYDYLTIIEDNKSNPDSFIVEDMFFHNKTLGEYKKDTKELENSIKLYDERLLILKQAVGRVKRYLKSFYKPKNYDEKTFEALCVAKNVCRVDIPKEFQKYYYLYPHALSYIEEHNTLFTNRDIRVNAIKLVQKNNQDSSNIGLIEFRNKALRAFGNLEESDIKNLTKKMEDKIELNIYKKIASNGDYNVLYDTVNMILQLRDAKIKDLVIKTKGSLNNLHNRLSKLIQLVSIPNLTFLNTLEKKDVCMEYNKNSYRFVFAKTPRELFDLGLNMNICVGSYYSSCIRYGTVIVSVEKNGILEACLEFIPRSYSKDYSEYEEIFHILVQAKGHSNRILDISTQRAVLEFCLIYGIKTMTCDITGNIATKHNLKINESSSKCLSTKLTA